MTNPADRRSVSPTASGGSAMPDNGAEVFERDGCRLRYWIEGPANAPLVVFSHGATCDHSMFDDQVAAVTGRYRMLLWDMRGQGSSRPAAAPFSCARAAEDLVALLDHLGEERVA